MRRSISVALITVCLTLAVPAARAGGGGTVFELRERFYAPGTIVEARGTQVWLGKEGARALEDGPYTAYLIRADRWVDPPRIPAPAIPLGRIEFIPEGDGMVTATLPFTVPDVEPGLYGIGYCNLPCTNAFVGDLVGGWLRVALDEAEARLVMQRDRYERAADARAQRLDRLRRQLDRLEERSAEVTGTYDDLRGTIFGLHEDLRVARERSGAGSDLPAALLGVAGGLIAGLVLGRRGRRVLAPEPPSAVREAERILERVP